MVQFLPQAQLRAPRNISLNPRTLADLGSSVRDFGVARQEAAAQENRKRTLADFAKTGDANTLIASGDNQLVAMGLRARESQANRAAASQRRAEDVAFRQQQFDLQKARFALEKEFKDKEFRMKQVERSASGSFKTPQDKLKFTQSLRKEHTDLSSGFRDRSDSLRQIRTNASNDSGPAGVALVFNFMRMLDPGSVVRESEQETLKRARDVFARMGLDRGSVEAAIQGNPLTPKQREQIVSASEQMFVGFERAQSSIDGRFKTLSENAGIDPNEVILPFGTDAKQSTPQPPAQPGQQAIQFLTQNLNDPDVVRQFDEKFGQGAAQRVMEGR